MVTPLRANVKFIDGLVMMLKVPKEDFHFVLVEGHSGGDIKVFNKMVCDGVRIFECGTRSSVLDDLKECESFSLNGIAIVDRDYSLEQSAIENNSSFYLDSNNLESFLLKNYASIDDCVFDFSVLIGQSKWMSIIRANISNDTSINFSLKRNSFEECIDDGHFSIQCYSDLLESKIPSKKIADFFARFRQNDPDIFVQIEGTTFEDNPWRWINGKDVLSLIVSDSQQQSFSTKSEILTLLMASISADSILQEENLSKNLIQYQNRVGKKIFKAL